MVGAGASMDIQNNVSTRIRLWIQTKYNPYVHCNKTITTNKCDILMYILFDVKGNDFIHYLDMIP